MTLLCAGKDPTFLDRFNANKYTAKSAIRDAKRHAAKLNVSATLPAKLEVSQRCRSKLARQTAAVRVDRVPARS